ncbi:hypothetical protein PLICRDRAFT_179739 [Plicaturopsis crispa FD-325 SS-3]|uniref:Uncharacterized protein n=1 Tax=Plicaturopsis crispa FD-325 SS-3 TaxID=944288 RepID=A0A0C9SKN7_PLICR|nr:hypothetical protein PLICRDRAFT_179739 [Plicaturopsis crispa FD-325 SS-3]
MGWWGRGARTREERGSERTCTGLCERTWDGDGEHTRDRDRGRARNGDGACACNGVCKCAWDGNSGGAANGDGECVGHGDGERAGDGDDERAEDGDDERAGVPGWRTRGGTGMANARGVQPQRSEIAELAICGKFSQHDALLRASTIDDDDSFVVRRPSYALPSSCLGSSSIFLSFHVTTSRVPSPPSTPTLSRRTRPTRTPRTSAPTP